MGLESVCAATWDGQSSAPGKVHLDTAEIQFRGDFRLKIPFASIKKVVARGDSLDVVFDGGKASFAIGAAADKWAAKILNPPKRIDKLGVKAGVRVATLGELDDDFVAELGECPRATKKTADIMFVAIEQRDDLAQVFPLARSVAPKCAVWAIYPKGQKQLKEADVRGTFREAGFIDVKVASFSATHTALKFTLRK